jgi:transcriptional regulator with XRE-family HTH domain
MTNLSASDVAALRIREARSRHGWTVKELAARCAKAGASRLTAPVITNLETRRRPGREISAEELLALAWVLGVPPVQLLTPVSGGEVLEVVPGQEMGPLDAPGWLADDEAVAGPVRWAGNGYPGYDERALRHRGSPLTLIRQVRAVAGIIRFRDEMSRHDELRDDGPRLFGDEAFARFGARLLHYLEALGGLGYDPLPLDDVMEILARHGVPPTLAELEQRQAAEEEGEPDGEGA